LRAFWVPPSFLSAKPTRPPHFPDVFQTEPGVRNIPTNIPNIPINIPTDFRDIPLRAKKQIAMAETWDDQERGVFAVGI